MPICSVNDDGALSNPRYSHPQFPPSNHEDQKIQQYARFYNVPVNAINVNSQRHPINTITGLQYFQGKALNMRIFKEKAVPKVGMGKCQACFCMLDERVGRNRSRSRILSRKGTRTPELGRKPII